MELLNNFKETFFVVLNNGVFGLSLINILIILILILISLFARTLFAKFIVNKIKLLVRKTGNKIDDNLFESLIPPLKLTPILFIFLIFSLYIDSSSTLGIFIKKFNQTLTTILVFWLIHQSLVPLSIILQRLEKLLTKALTNWILKSVKYLVVFLGIVAVLEVWGIKIGPIIAGLGLFGVAVALGAQDLFKNLISGVMILMEKRFQIGDVINVPGHAEGTVEHIGFRSTLIRKFDSTPISIPNYIFSEAPIINYSNRNFRRINWIIGLEYRSSSEQIMHIIKSIEDFIKSSSDFIIDDNHSLFVKIDKFNDSSIDILVYCFTNTNIWSDYLSIKEQLAINIKRIVEDNKASFAFPSQSVYIEQNDKYINS